MPADGTKAGAGETAPGAVVNEERSPLGRVVVDTGEYAVSLIRDPATGRIVPNQWLKSPMDKRALRSVWATWLASFDWQWFVTLTFPDNVHPEAARKRLEHWLDYVNRRYFGRRYKRRGESVYWACASELQKRGVLHYHLLVAGPEDIDNRVSRVDVQNRWYKLVGIAKVKPIRENPEAVTSYCCKYAVKDGEMEYSHNLNRRFRQPGLDICE